MPEAIRRNSIRPALAVLMGVGLLLWTSPATWAAGSQTQTLHAHGADSAGLTAIDFLPQDTPAPLPAGCWMSASSVMVSTFGNTIFHTTVNPAQDFWLTTTYTGDAEVRPILFDSDGNPVRDGDGNVLGDPNQPVQATGHLTTWFGIEDNNRNGVQHATLTFNGTDADGNPVTMHGRFQFAMNANGVPVVTSSSITC